MFDEFEKVEDLACVCLEMRRASRTVTQCYDIALASTGLRVTQFSLLRTIHLHREISISNLASETDLDRTTITRNLKPLLRDALVEYTHPSDQRIKNLRLSADGQALYDIAEPIWQDVQRRVIFRLGAGKWPSMIADLEQLSDICREV